MLGADSGTAPGFYFRTVGNEPAYPVHVFVVDVFDMVYAEGAYLPAGSVSATGPSTAGPTTGSSTGSTGSTGSSTWSTVRSAEWRCPSGVACRRGCGSGGRCCCWSRRFCGHINSFPQINFRLEWQVVDIVHGWGFLTHPGGAWSISALVPSLLGTSPQKLNVGKVNLIHEPGLTVPGLIRPGVKPAFHVHLAAFGQILVAKLGMASPCANVEPLCLFTLLTRRGGVPAAGGYAEGSYALAVGGVPHLRVSAKVANHNDLIQLRPPYA